MEKVIELHNWAAYQFGRFEYRLVGYVLKESGARCIVSEPIVGVDAVGGIIETANKVWFRPIERISTADRMDMMYALGRWIDLNLKTQPRDATDMISEELNKAQPKDEAK